MSERISRSRQRPSGDGVRPRVLIVGGGPAGMAAAVRLRGEGISVVVADRDIELGGVPRWTNHAGFGIRDMHRILSGPQYAARWAARVHHSGAEVRLSTTVLDVRDLAAVRSVGLDGPRAEAFDAVLLATGARERPRSARLIPGDRPAGVLTTGSLQHLVAAGLPVGKRAVIVGAEHVSFSALGTLRHGGCRPVALVTDQSKHSTFAAFRWATAGLRRVPIIADVSVAEVIGRGRVEGVVLSNGRRISCDTVVFTGDWIPDHELASRSGIPLDHATHGPMASTDLATGRPGIFAAGNLLRGAESADVCALEGRRAADSIIRFLRDSSVTTSFRPAFVPIEIAPADVVGSSSPIIWISPSAIRPDAGPARNRFILRVSGPVGSVMVTQGDRVLWTGRLRGRAETHRSCWIPATWISHVDTTEGAATVRIAAGVA